MEQRRGEGFRSGQSAIHSGRLIGAKAITPAIK
jgi:hypothetical protein